MSDTAADIIVYRMSKAWQSLSDANILAQSNSWSAVANRLYYAAFYMVGALIFKSGMDARSHSGLKTLFFKNFVSTGILAANWGEHYQQLFNLRSKSDYIDLFIVSENDVKPLIADTEAFLNALKMLIDTNR